MAPRAPDCTEALLEAQAALKKQDDFIKKVLTEPAAVGLVVNVGTTKGQRWVDVSAGGASLSRMPCDLMDAVPGKQVLLLPNAGITSVVDTLLARGEPGTVTRAVEGTTLFEISVGEKTVIAHAHMALEEGDRVVLDTGNLLVLHTLPAIKAPVAPPTVKAVQWSDVGGHADAKLAIEQAVLWPQRHRTLMAAYGQRPAKGILFSGPPGCGKTLLAKATATAMADGQAEPGFFSIKGPELMNPFVGETERKIRELFGAARTHAQVTGRRAVIFIDEADSCLGHRGYSLHSDISVPAFLVEMDGIEEEHAPLVLLATNRPEALDEAIVREGRVDRTIKIERPEEADVSELFTIYLKQRPTPGLAAVVEASTRIVKASNLWPRRSGAMVAALVDRMTASAMTRDIEGGARKPSGITVADARAAILAAAGEAA